MRKPIATCPICGHQQATQFRPFCSARCQAVDLGRWLNGTYRIPGPPEEMDEDPPPSPDAA